MKYDFKKRQNSSKIKYQICKRCLMDTSDRWISFDSNGVCNHCTDFLDRRITTYSKARNDYSELENLFKKIKSSRTKETKYDAVVGLSGGVDSCTTALLASKYGLRILAVHMNNCWDSPIATNNINKIISLPGVDYYCEVLKWDQFKKLQRIFIEAGVPDIDLPTDSAIQLVVMKVAAKFNVKVILSGGNICNEGIIPSSWFYNSRDTTYVSSVLRSANKKISIFSDIKFGLREDFYFRILRRIKTFYPLNTYNYDKKEARVFLENEIGWENPGNKHSDSIFTSFCQQIYQPKDMELITEGYLSMDVCLNKIERKKALKELEKPPRENLDVELYISYVSHKLGYTNDELKELMTQPALYYKDFPNREYVLNIIYNVYRLLRGKPWASNFWG